MAFVKLADNYTDLIGKFAVALREEGVERNCRGVIYPIVEVVALCEEGVDRNLYQVLHRAHTPVALREEGVDRNPSAKAQVASFARRPPRGGRG